MGCVGKHCCRAPVVVLDLNARRQYGKGRCRRWRPRVHAGPFIGQMLVFRDVSSANTRADKHHVCAVLLLGTFSPHRLDLTQT